MNSSNVKDWNVEEDADDEASSIGLNHNELVGTEISSDDTADFLNKDEDGDTVAVALLKQIFPEEVNTEALRRQHLAFCSRVTDEYQNKDALARIPKGKDVHLPKDFLRLHSSMDFRHLRNEKWEKQLIDGLEGMAITQHERVYETPLHHVYVTKVVRRNVKLGGLNMTLAEKQNVVVVHSVAVGPAAQVGVLPGDVLIGINGVALIETFPQHGGSLVKHAVAAIQWCEEVLALHLLRPQRQQQQQQLQGTIFLPTSVPAAIVCEDGKIPIPSLLDTSDRYSDDGEEPNQDVRLSLDESDLSSSQATPIQNNTYKQHMPHFIRLLAQRGAIHSREDELEAARMLQDLNFRAKQWDETMSYMIPSSGVFVPLTGVRKALSVRIVNTFQDREITAYTIWAYDLESGKEWYAPVRYLRDFEDLRTAILPLYPAPIARIPFPRSSLATLAIFRSPSRDETSVKRENTCRQLEAFLRIVCGMVYAEIMHPAMTDVAIHLQSFLGCDEQVFEHDTHVPQTIECSDSDTPEALLKNHQRLRLKRVLQLYTYRLFLLEPMSKLVGTFVDVTRTHGPRLTEIEALEAHGHGALKAKAMHDLGRIQSFLDKLQDLILEGCAEDFQNLIHDQCNSIHSPLHDQKKGEECWWDALLREAVREQVEIEVYVPLRSVVSRWLVHGWRHEDMEIQFKINELRKRPQGFFRVINNDDNNNRRVDWSSVSKILNNGVGLSTLPCVKLHAIVDAAREIFRIFAHDTTTQGTSLGADDFLPIFIYCVVQADIERPCALCVLLRTLCDQVNKIGEIGYYMNCFEAAVAHCQEVDLTEDRDEMQSFTSISLSDHLKEIN